MMLVEITTPEGEFSQELELPFKMRLADFVGHIFQLSDAYLSIVERTARNAGRRPTCRKGCAACCRQLVTVSPAEAFFYAELIESLPEPQRAQIESQIIEIKNALRASRLFDTLM